MRIILIFLNTILTRQQGKFFFSTFLLHIVFLFFSPVSDASSLEEKFLHQLDQEQKTKFHNYIKSQGEYNLSLNKYWTEISEKRDMRRKKRKEGLPITTDDFVFRFPPEYQGDKLPPTLVKKWDEFQEAHKTKRPPPKPLPTIETILTCSKEHYGFVPERIDEREFKRRYANEALATGLTKDQVVRVYALETSGLGTADMIAGIHPITKRGKPISTAIGYAQLLTANSTSELVRHGNVFVERLKQMAKSSDSKERAAHYERKADILNLMLSDAKSVPDEWSEHQKLGKTTKGYGIHAINIDGDIGPWLQVVKLEGLKKIAASRGKVNLSGAEIELMNLAGPVTGLEMMQSVAKDAPSSNFFERGAYARNTIVRGKSAGELLKALNDRMDINLKNEGAVVFASVFDELSIPLRAEK